MVHAVQATGTGTVMDDLHDLRQELKLMVAAGGSGKLAIMDQYRKCMELVAKMEIATGQQSNPFTDSIIENYRQRKADRARSVPLKVVPQIPPETEEEQAEIPISPWDEKEETPPPPPAAKPKTFMERQVEEMLEEEKYDV